jgi:hypothetical protein
LAARGVDVMLCLEERLGHGFLNRDRWESRSSGRTVTRVARGAAVDVIPDTPPMTFDLIGAFFEKWLRG